MHTWQVNKIKQYFYIANQYTFYPLKQHTCDLIPGAASAVSILIVQVTLHSVEMSVWNLGSSFVSLVLKLSEQPADVVPYV